MKKFLFTTLLSLCCGLAKDIDFITDSAWHFEHKLHKTWDKLDADHDGVLTPADKQGWNQNKAKDRDGDNKVTTEEYTTPLPLKNAEKCYLNVVYKEASGQKCLLDIYLPKERKVTPSPVLYFTHGGGWAAGTKDLNGNMEAVFNAMLAEGITCVSAAYRLVNTETSPPIVMEDCVIDCKDGLKFIAKHAQDLEVNMEKVCVFGNSAGGHICLMLAYTPPESFSGDPSLKDYVVKPVAGINWYGPVSFLSGDLFQHPCMEKPANGNRFAGRMMKGGKGLEYKDAPVEQQKMMEKLTPLTYFTKDSVPILTIHGDTDTTIPHFHSELLVKKAQEIGADVTYIPVKDAGHGFKESCTPPFSEINQEMVKFAIKHLY